MRGGGPRHQVDNSFATSLLYDHRSVDLSHPPVILSSNTTIVMVQSIKRQQRYDVTRRSQTIRGLHAIVCQKGANVASKNGKAFETFVADVQDGVFSGESYAYVYPRIERELDKLNSARKAFA